MSASTPPAFATSGSWTFSRPCEAARLWNYRGDASAIARVADGVAKGEAMTGCRTQLACGVLLAMSLPDLAQAAIRVNVHWRRVEYEVSPRQETHVMVGGKTFILAPGGVVTNDSNLLAHSAFGHPALMQNKNGYQYLTKYSIRGGHVIAVNRFAGSIETIDVSTDGRTSCSARVTYSKIPGQRFFVARRMSNGEEMFVSTRYAQDVTCGISSY